MKIGNFTPSNNIFLAPMAGVTDKSFRIICRRMGCGLVYTEMVSSSALYHGSEKTEGMMQIDDEEAPAAIQIFGSVPEIMGDMARIVSENPKDAIVDINMGCPAPKIVKNCDGSALMRDIKRAEAVIRSVVALSSKPVTVKIRKGWDDNSVNAVEFARMIEASGASAVAIHGRTRAQMYEGHADWDIIRQVKEAVNIPVIGNGDVTSPVEAKKLFEQTGCDAIMIGRGALGNPWIFKRTIEYMKTGELTEEPTINDKLSMAIEHFKMVCDDKGHKGIFEMRKQIGWYLKGVHGAAQLRAQINKLENEDEIISVLKNNMIQE